MMPASTGIMPDVIRGETRTQQASEHACSSAKGSFLSHRFFLSSFLPLFLLFNRYVYWKGRVRGRAARDSLCFLVHISTGHSSQGGPRPSQQLHPHFPGGSGPPTLLFPGILA